MIMDLYDSNLPNPSYPNVEKYHEKMAHDDKLFEKK